MEPTMNGYLRLFQNAVTVRVEGDDYRRIAAASVVKKEGKLNGNEYLFKRDADGIDRRFFYGDLGERAVELYYGFRGVVDLEHHKASETSHPDIHYWCIGIKTFHYKPYKDVQGTPWEQDNNRWYIHEDDAEYPELLTIVTKDDPAKLCAEVQIIGWLLPQLMYQLMNADNKYSWKNKMAIDFDDELVNSLYTPEQLKEYLLWWNDTEEAFEYRKEEGLVA